MICLKCDKMNAALCGPLIVLALWLSEKEPYPTLGQDFKNLDSFSMGRTRKMKITFFKNKFIWILCFVTSREEYMRKVISIVH